ncbi:hypothetical protein K435DRAFT_813902 [Dendrothele bispora CBS 962.96]|uniref:Uncharacterized protein n=1 Tax=Dendrothele bispora (strain CBS 962.96) TaxID=1314807 RepID=A0A4S8KL58_DENBC|nr:hypothetical protein K435DRAFT_813902 [Dendrothele bispora CBS 962.96]
MSTKRCSTPETDRTPKRPRHPHGDTGESHYAFSPAKNPPEHARNECPGHSSHAKAVEVDEAHHLPNSVTKPNIETWIGRVEGTASSSEGISDKSVTDVAVQTDSTTFPVDIYSVPYVKLSNRFAKVRRKCNDLHVDLDHAKLASEAGWTKFWRAEAECRELRKLVSEINKELLEARKAIDESTKELQEAREELDESTKELQEVREELDEVIDVKDSAVTDARFWRGKCIDMGGVPDIADHYDDYD